jgi:hypothetical protein
MNRSAGSLKIDRKSILRGKWAGIAFGLPALVLYTATPASFALLIAALRLTRPR